MQVTVNPGDTGRAIGTNLATLGVVRTAKAFADAAADNPAAAGIQPGEYTMKKEMKASDAVAYLVDPANRSVPMVTIPEGRWKSEVFALLAKASGKPVADYEAAAKDATALGLPAAAKGNVEGYLFPATYEFGKDTTPAQQLQHHGAEGARHDDGSRDHRRRHRADRHHGEHPRGRGPHDAGPREGRPGAAEPAGPEHAAAAGLDGQLRRAEARPHDHRRRAGGQEPLQHLRQPRPARRGRSATRDSRPLEAAKNPADGPWLFFVTVNPSTGETKFAATLAEHDQYVKEFQAWCQANTGKC